MSATITFPAKPRTATGSIAARKLRAAGQVPVTVSRPGKPSTLLAVDEKSANQFAAKVVHLAKLDVEGKPVTVLRGEIAKDPLTDRITHIDVIEVDEKATIKVDVAVVVDTADYGAVLADLDAHDGAVTQTLRRRLAQKAYARTASYDAAISNWLAGEIGEGAPAFRALGGTLAEIMLAASSRAVLPGLECVGPLKVVDTVTTTRLDISSGSLALPPGPGIGVTLDDAKLEQYRLH